MPDGVQCCRPQLIEERTTVDGTPTGVVIYCTSPVTDNRLSTKIQHCGGGSTVQILEQGLKKTTVITRLQVTSAYADI